MPKYVVTYSKKYEVRADNKSQSVEVADQRFTFDIREMLSTQGTNKINYLFSFKVEKIKKNSILKKKTEEK